MTLSNIRFEDNQKLFINELEFNNWLYESERIPLDLEFKELGDYQTPSSLVSAIYDILETKGISFKEIIEPTCGKGNFIIEALNRKLPRKIIGLEKQLGYVNSLKERIIEKNLLDNIEDIKIFLTDFFEFDLSNHISKDMLVIGNPPWITNSELSTLNSNNLPSKSNFKKIKGIDAITGKANFDIAEFILISLIDNLNSVNSGTIAFLVKNTVIRNILKQSKELDWNITTFEVYNIDAKKEFGVSADASLLLLRIGEDGKEKIYKANEFSIYEPEKLLKQFGWVGNNFVSDVEKYEYGKLIESTNNHGKLVWRSGVKHDASKIMELDIENEYFVSKDGETFTINDPYVYPLYKSSDIPKVTPKYRPRKGVIVTQKFVGEETKSIFEESEQVWNYLNKHKIKLNGRKSSIYKGKPEFSIFGIGDYSYKTYKIAISGMYKIPSFSLLLPYKGKTMMVDDTIYFLGTDSYSEALIIYALLNSDLVLSLLESIAFKDNKRPYSKDVLMRIDILKIIEHLSFEDVNKILIENDYDVITEEDYFNFTHSL